MVKVAIIGTGISGLTCAQSLIFSESQFDITLFEKARGPGGRISSRSRQLDQGYCQYDHGAPGFHKPQELVQDLIKKFRLGRLLETWEHSKDNHYLTAIPAMNALAKFMAKPLHILSRTRIERIDDGHLYDTDDNEYGPFDLIIFAIPAPQILGIMNNLNEQVHHHLNRVTYAPCRSVLVTSEKKLELENLKNKDIWEIIISQNKKPARSTLNSYVFHAHSDWSAKHVDLSNDDALDLALDLMDLKPSGLLDAQAHGWLYANITQPYKEHFLKLQDTVFACGDWCVPEPVTKHTGYRGIENAFLSGHYLAHHLLQNMHS